NGGTYVGSPTLGAPGALVDDGNTAVRFDGSTQEVDLANTVSFGSGDFTIEGWFKTLSSTTTQTIFAAGGSSQHARLYIDNGAVKGDAIGSSGSKTVTSASSGYADGAWHYAAFTRSGS